MKKILFFFIMLALMLNVASLKAVNPVKKELNVKETIRAERKQQKLSDAEIQKLVARIDEIKKMDVKSLPLKQKHELRKEVRDIRDKLNKTDDGIYIGGGALLVIIIILLILLL